MVKVYRDASKFNENNTIIDNESFFINHVLVKETDEQSLKVMRTIDNAELIDSNIETIVTPFGTTSIKNLSTGCKTALNVIFVLNNKELCKDIKAIDATECGWDALEEIFKLLENMKNNLGIIIEHDDCLYKCSDREYCIDDKEVVHNLDDF